MEKTVRSQNLKFSVEFPDDDRESHGVTSYEVVKKRKENGENNKDEENLETSDLVNENKPSEKGEYEWTIDTVQNETVKETEHDTVKDLAYKKDGIITEVTTSVNKTSSQKEAVSKRVIHNRNDIHDKHTPSNKTVAERKHNTKTPTETKPKPRETVYHGTDIGERLYKNRKLWSETDRHRDRYGKLKVSNICLGICLLLPNYFCMCM